MLPGDRPAWSNGSGRPCTLDSVQLPGPDWIWTDDWNVDIDPNETDDYGWAYAKGFTRTWHAAEKKQYLVRRRRYTRTRYKGSTSGDLPICMFSPGGRKPLTNRSAPGAITVKTSKSDWSAPLNLLQGTDTRVLSLFTHDFSLILDLGVYISPAQAPFCDTWIASFVPRSVGYHTL